MDDLYLITTLCLFPLVLLTILVGSKVNVRFKKYANVMNAAGLTAAEVARKILDDAGLFDVRVIRIPGRLTDNYNPKTQVLSLSESVYDSKSVSAVGIAAHEAGHALQYADEYFPVKLRAVLVPVCNVTSNVAMPLLLAGLLLELFLSYNVFSNVLFFIGVVCYGMYTVFTLVTLPVEFNASSRARELLVSNNIVSDNDVGKVRSVLNAAALTYVMSFALSLVQLLRIIAIFGGGKRRR